ncbi:MAG: BlaI/MecI/CopY family transcriptional regulator [Acidobacteriota bacterium]
MARHKSKTLTDGELRLMDRLWNRGASSVRDVWSGLPEEDRAAYNTVQTMLNILVDKGYVERRKEGRAFVYEALVSKASARTKALGRLTAQLFGGSKRELLVNLLSEETDAEELDELRRLLDEAKRKREGGAS